MVLTRADGLINNEFAGSFQPSCFKDPDGKLWFSTVGGIVVVDPKKFTQGSTQPILHIEKIICDRKEPMQITGNGPSTVNIQPGIQRIEIQYTGLNFSAPQNMHFKCKLEGFDADWVDIGTRRTVYYTGLAPGRYCFRVNGCGSNGMWNPTDVNIGLVVHPFFWQTLVFKLACLGILAGASAALAIYLTAKKHQRDLELSERKSEQRRIEELKVAYHQLQNQTSELEEAMRNVRTLSGLIPMCASCKKIRDDKGYWNRVEKYIQDHTDAIFSHGICPECARKLYGQYFPPSTDSKDSDT